MRVRNIVIFSLVVFNVILWSLVAIAFSLGREVVPEGVSSVMEGISEMLPSRRDLALGQRDVPEAVFVVKHELDVNRIEGGIDDFGRLGLPVEDRPIYDRIRALVIAGQTRPRVECDESRVEAITKAVLQDTPELVWCDSTCEWVSDGKEVTISFGVYDGVNDVLARLREVRMAAATIAERSTGSTDMDRALYTAKAICEECEYDDAAVLGQSAAGVLMDGKAVCAGYSRAFQLCMRLQGIPCGLVYGKTEEGAHAWNVALLDGTWCAVDLTWGDNAADGGFLPEYLGMTSEEIKRGGRTLDEGQGVPDCVWKDACPLVRNHDAFDVFDENALSWSFWRQLSTGGNEVAFKFMNDDAYAQACEALDAGELAMADIVEWRENVGSSAESIGGVKEDALRVVRLRLDGKSPVADVVAVVDGDK